jgi:hypothetical protein
LIVFPPTVVYAGIVNSFFSVRSGCCCAAAALRPTQSEAAASQRRRRRIDRLLMFDSFG